MSEGQVSVAEGKRFQMVLAVGSTVVAVAYQIGLTYVHNDKYAERHGQTLGGTKALESKMRSLNQWTTRLERKLKRSTRLEGKIQYLICEICPATCGKFVIYFSIIDGEFLYIHEQKSVVLQTRTVVFSSKVAFIFLITSRTIRYLKELKNRYDI